MFNFTKIIKTMWTEVESLSEEIKWALISIITLTIIGVFPSFCGTPIYYSFFFSFPIWIFSTYKIFFGFWRYLRIAIIGEVIDSLQAIGPETNKKIWDNQIAAFYRKAAVNIWLAQTVVFLAAPLYFNLTSGGGLWLLILIMAVFAIAMISIKVGLLLFQIVAIITIITFLILAGYNMFPQVGYIPFISEGIAKLRAGKEAGENIRNLTEVSALRERQRQQALARVVAKATTWQIANPGRDLPEFLRDEMEAAKSGLSISEYQEKKRREAKPVAPAISQNSSCKGIFVGVIDPSNNSFANVLSGAGGRMLEEGSYCLDPSGEVEIHFLGEGRPKKWGDSRGFTVPKGKKVFGIRSDHKVRVYRR